MTILTGKEAINAAETFQPSTRRSAELGSHIISHITYDKTMACNWHETSLVVCQIAHPLHARPHVCASVGCFEDEKVSTVHPQRGKRCRPAGRWLDESSHPLL